MSKFLTIGKGLLSKAFNTSAEDRRINKALKNMNALQLGKAMVNGIQNPETGETKTLTDNQKLVAKRELLKRTAQNRAVPR